MDRRADNAARRRAAGAGAGVCVALTLSLAALLAACDSGGPTDVDPDAADAAARSITVDELRAAVETIADDSMRGRATPSPGLELTARYVADQFAAAGLRPGTADGFLQRFDTQQVQPAVSFAGRAGAFRAVGRVAQLDGVNTLGWLEGSDPALRDEYVVFSAHMDHVGVRQPVAGDSIYNGADDNASGTAALVELAEAFARLETPPRRSLVFAAFGAEELGLLGSLYYASDPPFSLAQTVANLNMDMIGRNEGTHIAALRSSAAIGELAEQVGRERPELGLEVTDDLWPGQNLIRRSDQWAFIRQDVPALFFHSGLHEDYHQPSDEADRLDYDKLSRVARLLFYVGLELANAESPPR